MGIQSIAVELFIDGAFTAMAGDLAQGPVIAEVGPDPETGVQANKISCTLANDDLALDPENPASTYYNRIGVNTLLRARSPSTTSLAWGEVASWRPDRTPEHVPASGRGKAWVDLTAESQLRRIGRWEDPVRSALTRSVTNGLASADLLGNFPLEDPSSAAQFSNLISGGQNANAFGAVSPAAATGHGGSDKVVHVDAGGSITGVWARPTANLSGWQVSFATKLDATPASLTPLVQWQTTAGTIYTYGASNTGFTIQITLSDGTSIAGPFTTPYAGVSPTGWVRHKVKVTDIGTQVQVEPSFYPQDGAFLWGTTFAFTMANPGLLVDWSIVGQNAAYAHLHAISSVSVSLESIAQISAFNGYLGELAAARFGRLMTEEGLSGATNGTGTDTPAMGRQGIGTILELLDECSRTDGGLLFDWPQSAQTVFLCRNGLFAQTPTLALTYPTHLAPPIGRAIDDEGVANEVTVANADGKSATAILSAGPLSVQAPPLGVGRYPRSIPVNYRDATSLAQRAQFELAKRTLRRARYTSLTVDLVANPGLVTAVNNLRPGGLVTITGLEPEVIKLIAYRITHTVGAATRTCTIRCEPADVYDVGTYDAAASIYDTASTTLAAAATSTAISLSLTTVNAADCLPTTGTPYPLTIAGERVTVTAMTAPAGTGPYTQTATVTRSANGVVKAQLLGAEVHISYPVRYA